jgi:hypothetical protein
LASCAPVIMQVQGAGISLRVTFRHPASPETPAPKQGAAGIALITTGRTADGWNPTEGGVLPLLACGLLPAPTHHASMRL